MLPRPTLPTNVDSRNHRVHPRTSLDDASRTSSASIPLPGNPTQLTFRKANFELLAVSSGVGDFDSSNEDHNRGLAGGQRMP